MALAQGTVKGKVKEKATNEAFAFANIKVTHRGEEKLVKGVISDIDGNFFVEGLENGNYTLTISFVGYKDVQRQFAITADKNHITLPAVLLAEDTHMLKEVTVTGQKSAMKLEVDRKSFDVSQQIVNAGGAASDVLENIPSVEVDNDGNVSLRGNSSVEVWINGKASGLTSDNRAEILQQLPAESIDHIEIIDNPSAKFSAEGSAGIINIVLKKDRKAGYYGSLQVGGNTGGGANTSGNINYSSSKVDAYINLGYRHRQGDGGSRSRQEYLTTGMFENYDGKSNNFGNNLFSRAGATWHVTSKDDISIGGMFMKGGNRNYSNTPYLFGNSASGELAYQLFRRTSGRGSMNGMHLELGYRHEFSTTHFIDFTVSRDNWKMEGNDVYQDSTSYYGPTPDPTIYSYQSRPRHINNKNWEVKVDYENTLSKVLKLQAGYQGNFRHENTPQESFIDDTSWSGSHVVEDQKYFNRFIYDNNIHAGYATLSYNSGKFGLMTGLRSEYWRVNTESYTYEQEHDPAKREKPFKKDFFQLFPSVFMSYQITPTQQLQLNYTRRLRRPWGGELNSFRDTRDATMISFGNPELTPEYSNSFSLNYLKTWNQHSLLLSAYYRPTTDVIQRIRYQGNDGVMYSTSMNVAKSQSSGLEMTLKNKFFRILDLTTSANAYYYNLDGFSYDIEGQTVTGNGNHNFTWNARMQASIILPWDMSFQATGNYRAKQVITQGYRKASYGLDLGMRKNLMNKMFVISLSCRDVLNSRAWENYTSADTFTRYQKFWRNGRRVNLSITWNFGNMKKKSKGKEGGPEEEGEGDVQQQYNGGDEM